MRSRLITLKSLIFLAITMLAIFFLPTFNAEAQDSAAEYTEGLVTPASLKSLSPPFPVISAEVRRSPKEPWLHEGRLHLSVPVLQSKSEYLAVSLLGSRTQFEYDIPVGDQIISKNLEKAEIGLHYTEKLSGFRSWGLRGSIGYAGDRLFHNSNDTAFNIIANYGAPSASGGFWMWTLFFSNNSPIGNYIPIPGVMYITKGPNLTAMYGFPVTSVQWSPAKEHTYSFSLLGLTMVAEAAFGDVQDYQYFLTTKWTHQNYILRERKEDKDRLTLEEKKVGVGLKAFRFERALLEAEVGRAFDRLLYSGKGLRNMRSGSFDLDSDWYFSFAIKASF